MNVSITREEHFQQILIEHTTGEETTDELRDICIREGFYDGDPRITKAVRATQDRIIREMARQRGWVDEDGEPLELVNIVRKVKGTQAKQHFYMRLSLLEIDDQEFLVRDRLGKASYFQGEAQRYFEDGCRKFGAKFRRKFQGLLF